MPALHPVRALVLAAAGAAALGACATTPGPVEVTRFVDQASLSQLGRGTIFVESAPGLGSGGDSLELSAYKSAIARELVQLGYVETSRDAAQQVAQVRLERYSIGSDGNRGPVSVGVGGSTGSYGSGVGLGVGINLGGGSKRQVGTDLGVMIRDKASARALWEGRARLAVAQNSQLAAGPANAAAMADALFAGFPGNNGETIEVGVK